MLPLRVLRKRLRLRYRPKPGDSPQPAAAAWRCPRFAVMLTYVRWNLFFAVALLMAASGCSIKRFAINQVGNALAESGTTFASDDDPELIAGAVPFSLKLIESLLAETPRHRGLLLAACGNFTQYAYAFVAEDADELESHDLDKSLAMRLRARKLYLRARDYGLRGLDVRNPNFSQMIRTDPKAAVAMVKASDVPLLYWTAASWGLAISLSKDVPDLVADQPQVEALIDRALELDEDWDSGSIHGFLVTYESSRLTGEGTAEQRARKHFDRAVELTGGRLAGPFVSLAEAVSVEKQDRKEFESLLGKALAIDPNAKPEWRLNNLVTQRRARWLLGRADELFVE